MPDGLKSWISNRSETNFNASLAQPVFPIEAWHQEMARRIRL